MDNYLTTKEVSEKLNLSINSVYKLIKLKNFPSFKIGRQIYIPENEMDIYLKNHIGSEILI